MGSARRLASRRAGDRRIRCSSSASESRILRKLRMTLTRAHQETMQYRSAASGLATRDNAPALLALVDRRLRLRRVHVVAVDHHVARWHALLDSGRITTHRHHGIVDA